MSTAGYGPDTAVVSSRILPGIGHGKKNCIRVETRKRPGIMKTPALNICRQIGIISGILW